MFSEKEWGFLSAYNKHLTECFGNSVVFDRKEKPKPSNVVVVDFKKKEVDHGNTAA